MTIMPEPRIYTVEEANALIPWVRDRLSKAVEAADEMGANQRNLRTLERQTKRNGVHDVTPRISEADSTVQESIHEVQRFIREVQAKDIQVRDISIGLVDFPAERDGRRIWLCWRFSDPEILYWHELNSGFRDRRPLDSD